MAAWWNMDREGQQTKILFTFFSLNYLGKEYDCA